MTGRNAHPRKEIKMKDKFINFRATEKEKKQLTILAKKAKMSQAEFIRHAVFNKEIVVIDGLKPLQKELKRIGNNLNQLTTRSNMGHFSVVDLQETKDELRKIYEKLAELCTTKAEQVLRDIRSTDGSELTDDISDNDIPQQEVQQPNTPNECNTSTCLNEQNILPNHKPKLGERRNNSIFGNVFDRNRGD